MELVDNNPKGEKDIQMAIFSRRDDGSDVERAPLLLPPEDSFSPEDVESIAARPDDETIINDREQTSSPGGTVSAFLIVASLTFGAFIAQLEVSFVLATHGTISSSFGQLSNSSWILVSYSLATCASQSVYGKLSDIYGRVNVLLVASFLVAVGLIVSGLSPNFTGVVVGRVIAGFGGAGCTALTSLIILDNFPLRQVAVLRSYVNIAATSGRSLGGPIGGFLADTVGWRWSFLLQAPLISASGLLAWFLVPRKVRKVSQEETDRAVNDTRTSKLGRIDFAGAILLACTITSLLLAIELASKEFTSNRLYILLLLGFSLLTGVFFVITEKYWAPEPIFPLHLFQKKDVVCGYLVLGSQVAAQLALMFCVPVYFQVTQNASASVAGAHLFPAVAGNAIGSVICGIVIKKTGKYKILAILAPLIASVCYGLLIVTWHGNTNIWESLYIIPGGFGTGMAEASVFVSLSASVDQSLQAVALSGLFLAANLGAIMGLVSSSSVLQAVTKSELESKLSTFPNRTEIVKEALSDIHYGWKVTGKLHDIVIQAYVTGLEYTHGVSLVCVALAFVAALALRQHKL